MGCPFSVAKEVRIRKCGLEENLATSAFVIDPACFMANERFQLCGYILNQQSKNVGVFHFYTGLGRMLTFE